MSSTTNASNDNGSSNGDPWSYSKNTNRASSRTRKMQAPKAAKHVPDAWDDEEGDEGEEEEKEVEVSRPRIDNRTLWNDANARQPMPEVILRTSSTSASAAPPPEVLQQPMRILKRPSTSSSATSVNTIGSASGVTTLRSREAAYEAARARIFGGGKDGESGGRDAELRETQERLKAVALGAAGSKAGSPVPSPPPKPSQVSSMTGATATPTTSILRNPHGPPSSSSSSTNGSPPPISDTSSSQMTSRGFAKRRGCPGGGASGHDSGKTGTNLNNTGSSSPASASSLKS